MSQIEIFYSYSHKDEQYREELEKQLSLLKWQGVISNWTDRRIGAGQEWAGEINKHLDTAQIILLLVSPDFVASQYCHDIEVKRAMERHERGEARVIPIILRYVHWQSAPFGKLQALPKDAKPVKSWPDQDEAFYNVAEGIRKVVEDLKAKDSEVSAKPIERPIVPSTPPVLLSEHSSQPDQSENASTNTENNVASLAPQFLVPEPAKVEVSSPIKLLVTQGIKTFQLKHVLVGHSKAVNCVAISPDGQTLVSGGDDKVRVWNLHTGELLRVLKDHTSSPIFAGGVLSVAISSDGQTLVSGGGDDKTVRVWNLHTGAMLHALTGHENWVWSVAISPDGQMLVSGCRDTTIRVWNLHTGAMLHALTGHENTVRIVAISPDGQMLVSGSIDKIIRVWNLHTGNLLRTLTGHQDFVNSVAISPDGQTIVSGSNDKTVRVWNLHTGALLHTLTGNQSFVKSVAISPDGRTIVSGSDDKTVRVWGV